MHKDEILEIAARLVKFANELQGTDYVEFPDGGIGCRVEHWGVKHLAKSLMDTFEQGGDPPNYLVMVVGHPDDRQVEVTLRPLDKCRRTPAADVVDLKGQIVELNRHIACQDAELASLRLFKQETLSRPCEHEWKPIQNFSCKVYAERCQKCNKTEMLA